MAHVEEPPVLSGIARASALSQPRAGFLDPQAAPVVTTECQGGS